MSSITRREGLAMAMSAAACGWAGAPARAVAAPPGLNDIAAAKGLRFGSTYKWSPPGADAGSFANPAYAALLERDCALLVPENEMKWQHIRPSATSFDFAPFDAMVDYAERKRLAVRGHNLLWHQPKWMPRWEERHDFGRNPSVAGGKLLTDHIRTILARYGKRIGGYDVVNEAVNPADGTLYETALSRAIGGAVPTLDLAFRTARAAAPHAQLVYNDYMSWEADNAGHRAGVLALLEGFRKRGTPVDALGVQSHIITQGIDARASFSSLQGEWRRFLDAVTAMGYTLLITEFDVRDNNLPADPAVRDRAVGDYTRAYLDVTLSYPQLRDVLVWGMTDRYSWIEGFEPRADHARRRPCPYDDRFRPKPMRDAIAAAFAAAPARPQHA